MDQSYTDSDVSLSPSQILERLQVLRQLQLLQRGKLQKQRLEYQETSENSSSITEIVSHFSNSTSYNTFRSLLESAHDSSTDGTPRLDSKSLSQKVKQRDLIEGVSLLNLSQESEFIVNSPVSSSRSLKSAPSKNEDFHSPLANTAEPTPMHKKQIALEDMPILSPKKDFEALLIEKLQVEKTMAKTKSPTKKTSTEKPIKRQFLRKGEGMSRFGLQKNDLVIQNTKALPWRRKSLEKRNIQSPLRKEINKLSKTKNKNEDIEIIVTKPESVESVMSENEAKDVGNSKKEVPNLTKDSLSSQNSSENVASALMQLMQKPLSLPTGKHPLTSGKGKTWASVLTKEQNDFLRQLKQSDYYKNYASPAKSTVSDVSCNETLSRLRNEREIAEQNMFELLESKVCHESFNLENSFFNKFLRRSKFECSGESTPLVMQHCLANNPDLMHIYPNFNRKKRNESAHSDVETCNSECSDCCSETCSSVSSSCSCKTVEETNNTLCSKNNNDKNHSAKTKTKDKNEVKKKEAQTENNKETKNDTVNDTDTLQSNMVEMNAKLIATSELLKNRLHELEDEIETFRQENANLTKMREEIDAERQKFYEEKNMFEQKFNEEKILSEYYLAEEKEKLTKQKQMYDKYVREMRGRLNKKDKDEVLNLRKEISDLKEEIRLKDAKSTSTIARLRNQIKLMEKEKKSFLDEIEKLKKENRRIQHSNDMTRRMTNLKYLEQINKKLSNMTAKETQSEVVIDTNAKYKTFEIERQSRSRKLEPNTKIDRVMRTRAKSVPNLNVTSRYAKYFSQRDVLSDFEKNKTVNIEPLDKYDYMSDNGDIENEMIDVNDDSFHDSDSDDDNNLEKLYIEWFHSVSPKSTRSNISNPSTSYNSLSNNPDTFFITKTNSNRDSKSPSNTISSFNNSNESNRSKSPISVRSQRSSDQRSPRNYMDEFNANRDTVKNLVTGSRNSSKSQSKSPMSILTNRSSVQKPATVIHNENYRDRLPNVSSEPSLSKSSLNKTNLNPTEIKKPDGSKELRFPNGNVKFISSDGKYSKFVYYNGDVKENFYSEGRIKYFYAETKTYHTTQADGLEVLEFPDGQVEKRYKDGSTEIRLPNGSVRYFDPKNEHVREEWRFPDGAALTISANGEQRVVFCNGQVEVHAKDHKRREFPDGTVKLVYNDGTSETRYASGRVRIKDKHGNLIMDSAPG